jgi:RNase P protein component
MLQQPQRNVKKLAIYIDSYIYHQHANSYLLSDSHVGLCDALRHSIVITKYSKKHATKRFRISRQYLHVLLT